MTGAANAVTGRVVAVKIASKMTRSMLKKLNEHHPDVAKYTPKSTLAGYKTYLTGRL